MSIKLKGSVNGSVSLDVPGTLGSDHVLTLPNGVGSAGQYLRNTGTAGELEFGDLPAAAALTRADMPAGSIIQVIQTVVTSPNSTIISANTVTNISGMNATITPTSTSSKVFVKVSWTGEHSTTNYNSAFGIKRGTTIVGQPTASIGSRRSGIAPYMYGYFGSNEASTIDRVYYEFLDSPSTTSATTYYATWNNDTAGTLYTGRTVEDTDNSGYERMTAFVTLMEVAG